PAFGQVRAYQGKAGLQGRRCQARCPAAGLIAARRLGKGPNRPVNTLADRAELLAALRPVDGVVSYPEDTPCAVIAHLRPEVHVKGGDYREEDLPEAQIVRSYGGRVVIFPTLPGRSTTATLRRAGLE
ncbi:MAG: hypothetical protein WHU10_12030, partial [Fimbriimonadales bacterium]